MERTFSGRMSRFLSVVAVVCIGFYFVQSNGLIQKKHGLQWKIDQVKKRVAESERLHEARKRVVYLIPPGSRDSMELCLLKAYASPIKWIESLPGLIREGRCDVENAPIGYFRFKCPYSTRAIAERCATKAR